MRIALILSKPPGYSETFFRSKIQGLLNHGHTVILVTGRTEDKFNLCDHIYHPKVYKNTAVQLFMIFKVFMGLLPYFKTIKHYIALEKQEGTPFKRMVEKLYINAQLLQLKVDWVHFGFATMAIDREFVAKAIGAKMAVSFRGFDIGVYPLKHPDCYNKLWSYVNKVHTISNDLLSRAYALGLLETIIVNKITPAIDTTFFINELPPKKKPEKLSILTIGRLHWKKGYVDMLKALKHLSNDGIDFEYSIIGEEKDYERIAYIAYKLGILNKIKFLGKQTREDVKDTLEKTDIYLQYSVQEGFCNAVLEAQAMQVLCIVSDAEGLPENVLHEETGWVVPKNHPILLANKIVEVINLQDIQKQKIKEQAIKRVKQTFGLEQQQKAFHQFYTA